MRNELWLFLQLICSPRYEFLHLSYNDFHKDRASFCSRAFTTLGRITPVGRDATLLLSSPHTCKFCFFYAILEAQCQSWRWPLCLCLIVSVYLSIFQKCYEWMFCGVQGEKKVICNSCQVWCQWVQPLTRIYKTSEQIHKAALKIVHL